MLEYFDQSGIHVLILIGDSKADQPGATEMSTELRRNLAPVDWFHDEYEIGPVEQFGRQRRVGALVDAVGLRRRLWLQLKNMLSMANVARCVEALRRQRRI